MTDFNIIQSLELLMGQILCSPAGRIGLSAGIGFVAGLVHQGLAIAYHNNLDIITRSTTDPYANPLFAIPLVLVPTAIGTAYLSYSQHPDSYTASLEACGAGCSSFAGYEAGIALANWMNN